MFFYSDNDTGAFFDNLFRTHFKMFPERIGPASGWSYRIDGTFFFYFLKKNTLQAMLSNTFLTGKSIPNAMEIFLYKVNPVHLQELTNPAHFLLAHPDITRLTATARTWAGITCTGIKRKIKTIHLDNIQFSLTLY
jgi:hypothetical protein